MTNEIFAKQIELNKYTIHNRQYTIDNTQLSRLIKNFITLLNN